jgi:hypothetical protein
VNRLAQFLHYGQKVFGLKTLLRGVRDERPQAKIPTPAVLLCLFLGAALRISSYLDLSKQTQRRGWRRLCGLKEPLSHDTFAYVTERLSVGDLRQCLAGVNQKLKANKALESCKLNGLLFVSLDANEHFSSRSRCCESCCQRQIEELGPDGQKHQVTEYYHRYVFAQINGPKLNTLLDLEPIRPGEAECGAALRLLGRLRRVYGPRFFDAITVDGWYVQGPFLRAVEKLGWEWIVVLKQERLEVFQEARQLSQNQKPVLEFADEKSRREVRLWDVKDLHFSRAYGRRVRVVHSEEKWEQKRIQGGQTRHESKASDWWWMASAGLDGYGAQVVYQAGHRRWGIENKAFNELTQFYHLEHCYHHEAVSMLAQMLILMLGFTLFTAFSELHNKVVRLGQLTAKALCQELNLALEEDLPWEQWFHSG